MSLHTKRTYPTPRAVDDTLPSMNKDLYIQRGNPRSKPIPLFGAPDRGCGGKKLWVS